MSTTIGEGWALVEFVGGPRDGELRAEPYVDAPIDAAEAEPGYVERSTALHLATATAWNDAKARAILELDHGTPDEYVRMIWYGSAAMADKDRKTRQPPSGHVQSQIERLERALAIGAEHEAQIIAAAFWDHTPSATQLIELLLAPALRKVGDQWAQGEVTVYQEHRASAIVTAILSVHSGISAEVVGRRVAVACLPGEAHVLPVRMAAVALCEDGWQVEHLGGPTPVHELLREVHKGHLDLVVLSTTQPLSLEAAIDARTRIEPHGVPVLIGTPGKTLGELQRLARRATLR